MRQISRNLRYFTLYLFAFLRRNLIFFRNPKSLFIFLIIFVVLLAGAVFFKNSFRNKGFVVEGLAGTYREEDLPDTVNYLLSSSLVTIDKTGQARPNLVENWLVSEDGKTYTFKLKNNLFWLNGEKIKAQDIDVRVPVDMVALDDNTLQFKLAENFSPFPTLLIKPIFKKGTKIGLGPYKIDKVRKDPGNRLFVTKVFLSAPDYPSLVMNFYDSERKLKTALELGEVQVALGLSDPDNLALQKNIVKLQKNNLNQLVTIFYNTKDPILSDENLRLALSYGAPLILGELEAKTSVPSTSWAFNDGVKDFLDNPEQAKASLKKVQNLDNLKKSPVTLTATSSLGDVGQRIVDSWNKVGIKSVLRIESGIPQNFQALLIAQNIPSDPDQYSLWHSTQTQTNISHFSNPRVDKDLEDGRKEKDLEVRKGEYHDFQKVLLDNAPATFLYFPKYNILYFKKVEEPLMKILNLQLPQLQS